MLANEVVNINLAKANVVYTMSYVQNVYPSSAK